MIYQGSQTGDPRAHSACNSIIVSYSLLSFKNQGRTRMATFSYKSKSLIPDDLNFPEQDHSSISPIFNIIHLAVYASLYTPL